MTPRIGNKAMELIQSGSVLNKYELASAAFCDQRSAQRALTKLHSNGVICVARWDRVYKQYIPAFSFGSKDARKPRPKTAKQLIRERRKDPEYCMDENIKKRIARTKEKIKLIIESGARDGQMAD